MMYGIPTDLRARRTAKQAACAASPVGHVLEDTETGQKCGRCGLEIQA